LGESPMQGRKKTAWYVTPARCTYYLVATITSLMSV